jgi:hypothetical protein
MNSLERWQHRTATRWDCMKAGVIRPWCRRRKRRSACCGARNPKYVVTVQRTFRRVYRKDAPTDKSIRKWYQQFQETGSVLKGHSPGWPSTSQDDTGRIRVAFQRSPKRSVRHVSRHLQIPKSTVHDVHSRLKLRAYKLQVAQHIQPRDKPKE